MGIFDIFKPTFKTYTSRDIALRILTIGTGVGASGIEIDFSESYSRMLSALNVTSKDEEAYGPLLYFELVAVRLMSSYLFLKHYQYMPAVNNPVKLDEQFTDIASSFLSAAKVNYNVDIERLFTFRFSSYTNAFNESNKNNANAHILIGNVFYVYVLNSLQNCPLQSNVSSDPGSTKTPWMDGRTSLPVYRATQDGFSYCHSLILHIFEISCIDSNAQPIKIVG